MANTLKMPDGKTDAQPKRWNEKLDQLKAEGGRRWKSLKERVDTVLDQLGMAFKKRVPIERERPPGRHW
jgi:hypothetical protein